MKTYLPQIVAFINDEDGASAVEYALLLGMVALAITGAAFLMKGHITNIFESIAAKLSAFKTAA